MHYYSYKLISPVGQVVHGRSKLPYSDLMSAIYHLERDGSTTLYVRKLGPLRSWMERIGHLRLHRRLPKSAQSELLGNIALMLRSGVTLTSALEEASGSLDRPSVTEDIRNMVTAIKGGSSFSEAARRYPYIFPKAVIHLIRIGEETGRLDEMLKNASEHLKKLQAIISDTKQALMYPAMVLTVMTAGFFFWVYYVAPQILSLFEDMDIALPGLTVAVMKTSYFLRDYSLAVLLAIVMILLFVYAARRASRGFRKATDAILLRLPVAGTIATASVLAFITEYFSLLLHAGVDLLHSMKILREAVGNMVFRDKLHRIRDSLTRGEGIADSFQDSGIFPTYVIRMLNVGEMSGTLSEQLDHIAKEYRNRLSYLVASLGKMIEPIILIVAGVLFAVIIAGLLLPVYDLASQVSG